MVEKTIKAFLIILLIQFMNYTNFSCTDNDISSGWWLQWQFFSCIDSLQLNSNFYCKNTTSGSSESGNNGIIWEDSLNDSGYLFQSICMAGTIDETWKDNPNLKCNLLYKDSIIFDTIFKWDEMKFGKHLYIPYGEEIYQVSDLKFYVDVPGD